MTGDCACVFDKWGPVIVTSVEVEERDRRVCGECEEAGRKRTEVLRGSDCQLGKGRGALAGRDPVGGRAFWDVVADYR